MTEPRRQSIRPTFDSRRTGPAYHVTTRVGDHTVSFQQPVDDPFVRTTVVVGWRDAIRELIRHRCVRVTVLVGGDKARVDDVLELDENSLVPNSTRRAAFMSHLNERLAAFDPDVADG